VRFVRSTRQSCGGASRPSTDTDQAKKKPPITPLPSAAMTTIAVPAKSINLIVLWPTS
jgi:hypothetical protein